MEKQIYKYPKVNLFHTNCINKLHYSTGKHKCKSNGTNTQGKRDTWTNEMKLELLHSYIEHADNIGERDDRSKMFARKKTKAMLKPIMDTASITINGKSVSLKTYKLDTMALYMVNDGLSSQPKGQGLLQLIDDWVNKKGLDVKDVKDRVEEFLDDIEREFLYF